MPRLENWSVGSIWNGFQAPELEEKQLRGAVYEDEFNRFEDGMRIQTSLLVELNLKDGYAQTLNTKYILGNPSEDYLKWLEDNNMSLDQFIK